ncbi:MAG: hypothetical protein ABII18_02720 [bacterium]|nr:hypothetical protein [bacterium]MBU1916515.1 hypothetical protein [bacterium]
MGYRFDKHVKKDSFFLLPTKQIMQKQQQYQQDKNIGCRAVLARSLLISSLSGWLLHTPEYITDPYRRINMSSKKEKSRREFLTTVGVVAAGTLVGGKVMARDMSKVIGGKATNPGITHPQVGGLSSKLKEQAAKKFTSPTGLSLTQAQYKDENVVKQDIAIMVQEIKAGIDEGRYNLDNVVDGMHDMGSVMIIDVDQILSEMEGMKGRFSPGSDGEGIWGGLIGCGSNCYGGGDDGDNSGHACGCGCDGSKGDACGNDCPNAPDDEKIVTNPFIDHFMNNVATQYNWFNPSTQMLFNNFGVDIVHDIAVQTQGH